MRTALIAALVAALAAAACGDDAAAPADDTSVDTSPADTSDAEDDVTPDAVEDTGPTPPDPAFVHVLQTTATVGATDPFVVDLPTQYRTSEALPDLDVRALAVVAGGVWAGAATGLYELDAAEDRFVAVTTGVAGAPVLDIAAGDDADGRVVVLQEGVISRLSGDLALKTVPAPGGPWSAVAARGGAIWVGGEAGLARVEAGALVPVAGSADAVGAAVVDLDVAGDTVWAATSAGLVSWKEGAAEVAWAGDVRAVAVAPDGATVWAATATGAVRVAAGEVTTWEAGLEGLPTDDGRAIAAAGDVVALGWGLGASAFELLASGAADEDAMRRHYYTGLRWLPAAEVPAVAVGPDGDVWLGTPAGLTHVTWEAATFAAKAEAHETLLADHFWRMDGFVSSDAVLDDAWSPTTWWRGDKDNDGLWTQMQVGAWCYAYAVTGDDAHRQRARKAMDTMFLLVDIPAVDFGAAGLARGYVSRSLVRDDEGDVFTSKAAQGNWHLVTWEGRDYYWKDDTSSDELAGHFFGLPLFYDLCARDDAERAEVASYAADISDYIIAGGFDLIDLDGERTTHGHWNPADLSSAVDGIEACEADLETCFGAFGGHGWLNSVEILGQLLATWHMTGEARFLDAYTLLVEEFRFDEVATPHDLTATITFPNIANHSDHELAMLAYHTLIRYEPDDTRRQLWIDGLLFLYSYELDERNPLWAAFVSLAAGAEHAELEPALQSLRLMPDDRRELRIDNSHRQDSAVWPNDRHGDPQFERVFPYDENRTIWWNGNFHAMVHGGDGRGVSGPMAWLLPYWGLRYAGVIGE